MLDILLLSTIIGINAAFNVIHMIYINNHHMKCKFYTYIHEEMHTENKRANLLTILTYISWLNIIYLLFVLTDPDSVRIED